MNNQWIGGIAAHPAPKILSAKIRREKSHLDILGSGSHPLSFIFQGPNYKRKVLLISVTAI
jgi:hypothetical protein